MKFGQFMSSYKRNNFMKKIPQKLRPGNQFQTLLSLQRINHNLYWKMKLLKQATHIRHKLAKLSKFVQISTDLLRLLFTEDSLKIKKGLEPASRPYFSYKFLIKIFFCNIT